MNPHVRKYLLAGLSGTPEVLSELLKGLPADDPRWDIRPHAERFTLREMAAHVADWEEIWLERVTRTATENSPILPDVDEDRIALERDYAQQDPIVNLKRISTRREELVRYLSAMPDAAWSRVGVRPPTIGEIELDALAAMILGHDGYHTKQTAEYLQVLASV